MLEDAHAKEVEEVSEHHRSFFLVAGVPKRDSIFF
jgi:hypothetical protein